MAGALNVAVFFLSLCLLLVGLGATQDPSPMASEVERPWSNVVALVEEASVAERNHQLKSKGELLAQLDKTIMEISTIFASLRAEMIAGAFFQEERSSDSQEPVREAHFQSVEIKSQISKLEDDIKFKVQKKDGLETRVSKAEMKVEEFNLDLRSLQKTTDEQRSRIQRIVLALKDAEKGLMNVHVESSSKTKKKIEDHVPWLSHWLSVHVNHFQERVPRLKQHRDFVAAKAVRDVSRRLKLCFDPVLTGLKPHMDKIHEVLKSFSEPISFARGKFYHQIELVSNAILKKALAAKDLVWFV